MGEKSYLDTESLLKLIKAVKTYRDDLLTNKLILLNAANICDQAMGSDANAKKHIENLNNALVELDKTSNIASKVFEALVKDYQLAIATNEDD